MMMKIKPLFILVAIFWLVSLACQLPTSEAPDLFTTSTPDLTGTAFFAALLTPTLTPQLANTATPSPEPAATQTSPPTETLTPTSVSTSPSYQARNGALVLAKFMTVPPVIDGNLAEWSFEKYPVKSVVYGPGNWTSNSDLSAEVMVGWDDNNLYLAAFVTDDMYVQTGSGETIYKGDSLEILLDTKLDADLYVARLSPDDFQLGISPGSPTAGRSQESYLWFPVSIAGPRNRVGVGAVKVDGGYQIEALIPWSIFEISPQAGMQMGFACSVSDNDLVGQTVQQTMVSLVSNRHLTDPTTWGKIVLEK